MEDKRKTVAVLGASDKEDRYSNRAIKLLLRHNHRVIPVHPRLSSIAGLQVVPDLPSINEPVHTLTIYLTPARQKALYQNIIDMGPQRVIFNPGTENPEFEKTLRQQNIECVRSCTLVMLHSGQF